MELNNHAMIRLLSSSLGLRLKKLRRERGLTQKELAAKISGGIDYTYIGKIERGQQLPSLKVLLTFSESLSVPLEYFFGEIMETRVYLSSPSDSGDIFRSERGQELLLALKLLAEKDIPIIVEIIRALARHREPDKNPLHGEPFDSEVIFPVNGNMGRPRKKRSDS
jgi:transcriptional regulator with XRE-family HTH domain